MMAYTAAVITVSDKGARGERIDTSGPAVAAILQSEGYDVTYTAVIPDDRNRIQQELISCCDNKKIALVITTGGTGFSPRDVTPEATLAVSEREVRGIPEAMRAASMRITPRGCLSRSAAGIRGQSLIINLPGSEKAAKENLLAVLAAVGHGLDMLGSKGSADCASPDTKKMPPSMDQWLREAKSAPDADQVGMYLVHNGTVRSTARSLAREGMKAGSVTAMDFSFDPASVKSAEEEARKMEGIFYVRIWLNKGRLNVGDDLMYVLIGGDIRSHVFNAMNFLVNKIKTECVSEKELF